MASIPHTSYTDFRDFTFNDVGRDQVNMVFSGSQDSLEKLKPVEMNASKRTSCLQDTRTALLQFVFDWINDTNSQQNILWIHGLAGSGKSTLSNTIASVSGHSGQLGAFLFFDRDVTERSDPAMVIRTLAHQLGSSDPRLGAAIRAIIERNSNILLSPLALQFQRLIFDPLASFDDPISPIVVVLDALDECGTAEERGTLLEVLANDFGRLPLYIRTIVTSRAEIDICNAFKPQQHILARELDITSPANSDDILSYFQYRMALIRSQKRHLRLAEDWPGERVFLQLVQRASGLFVWASTVSEFINGHDPRKRLDVILSGEITSGAEAALDILYKTALESIGCWDDEDFTTDFREIMGIVLIARQPLSSRAIDTLMQLPEDRPSMHTISLLGCVLQQSPTVRVLHPSFADFLMTRERCRRDTWFFNQSIYHRILAFRCLDRMNEVLKRNMCNMTLAVDQTHEMLPEDVAYSCLFWIDHISSIGVDFLPVMVRLCDFLNQHLLHWFEAMSILRKSRYTIPLLDHLIDWISPHAPNDTKLLELVRDASRFARVFAPTIEEHPLLVYMSALPFIPTTSALYRAYHDADICPSILGGSRNSWTPLLLVMPGYMKGVNSVGFSPDGTHIVSGSVDNTIRVWNSITGAEVLEIRGHRNRVTSVAFSPDGCQIVSGSYDKTVRIWNCTTGAEVLSVSRGQEEVIAVAFSPDGMLIASGSSNATMQILDVITGAEVSVLRGHEEAIHSLAFSPNGRTIVSGSCDKTIRVWDVITSSVVSEMRGHHSAVEAVDFSPDGGRIVSGSWDESIRLWDAMSGAEIQPAMQGHVDGVQSVAFSPDGNRIISGSLDATIRIWDVATGVEIRSLQGHNHYVCSVGFSPDGTKIVSGSWDDTIRVWDATVGAELLAPPIARVHENHMHSTLHEPLHDVYSIAFSPDGTKIVSGSKDAIIRLWDSTTGAIVLKIRGHRSSVLSANFSPNGDRLVSGSLDMTVRVWNATTGAQIFNELRGHPQGVHYVAFSLDGSRILSKSRLRCISWDAETGCQLHLAKEPGYPVFQSILITHDKWVIHSLTGRTICKLPPLASTSLYVSHHSSLAVRTDHGQVFVMHFPPSLLTSSETRLDEGKGRLLGISEEKNVFSEEEEPTSEVVHKQNQTVGLL